MISRGAGITVVLLAGSLWTGACGSDSPSPASQSPAPTPPLVIYEPGNGVSLPTVVKEVKPAYTPQALAARIQGSVLLSAVVLPDGTVGDVSVLRSLDPGLDGQAVFAMKQWLFNPGMKDGISVAVRVTIEFTFTIATSSPTGYSEAVVSNLVGR